MGSANYRTLPNVPAVVQPAHWGVIVPEARTNLITNPSFEIDASTGWTTLGTVTRTRDTTQSRFGGASMKLVATATTSGAFQDVTSLVAGALYVVTVRVKVTVGSAVVQISDSGGSSNPQTQTIRRNDTWQTVTIARNTGAVSGIRVQIHSAVSSATFFVDGVQLEAGGYATTYIDGDQPGCYWVGQSHLSTSARNAWARQGGRVMNLRDFKFVVAAVIGAGAPALNTVSTPYALGGAQYQRSVAQARDFTIAGQFQAASAIDLRRQKQSLYNALKPDAVSPQQPVRLVYQPRDANDEVVGNAVYVDAVYTGGLEGNDGSVVAESAALGFRVHLPWIGTGETDVAIALPNSAEFTSVALFDASRNAWVDTGHPRAKASGQTVVGKLTEDRVRRRVFAVDYDGSSGYVRMWNGASWSTIGTVAGVVAQTYCVLYAPDGYLYVGGQFTSINGVSATNIARWDGATWTALGSGSTSPVNALAWSRGNQLLAGSQALRRWNGTTWTNIVDVSSGSRFGFISTTQIQDIAVSTNGDIWAATNLNQLSGLDYKGLIRVTWASQVAGTWGIEVTPTTLWLNAQSDTMHAMPNGDILVSGLFTTVGNLSAKYVFRITSSGSFETGAGGVISTSVVTKVSADADGNIYLALTGNPFTVDNRTIPEAIIIKRSPNGLWKHGLVNVSSTASGTHVFDSTYGIMFATNSWAIYPSRSTVTSLASGFTPITFVINGPGTLVALSNNTTGNQILFENLVLLTNEIITIRTGPGATIVSNIRGDMSSYLTAESNLYTLGLQNGDNEISALYSTSTGSIAAHYRPRYDSIDQSSR